MTGKIKLQESCNTIGDFLDFRKILVRLVKGKKTEGI
jgi:hypothetical protein